MPDNLASRDMRAKPITSPYHDILTDALQDRRCHAMTNVNVAIDDAGARPSIFLTFRFVSLINDAFIIAPLVVAITGERHRRPLIGIT